MSDDVNFDDLDIDDLDLDDDDEYDYDDDDDEDGDDDSHSRPAPGGILGKVTNVAKEAPVWMKAAGVAVILVLVGGIGYGLFSLVGGGNDTTSDKTADNVIYTQSELDAAYKDGQAEAKAEYQEKYEKDSADLDKNSSNIKKLQVENKSLKAQVSKQSKDLIKVKKSAATKEENQDLKIDSLKEDIKELRQENNKLKRSQS